MRRKCRWPLPTKSSVCSPIHSSRFRRLTSLGRAINKIPGLSIKPISDSTTDELYRAIRSHLPSLIPGLMPDDVSTMSLGLSHSLARHKLKFSPDKIDTMIVQAIALLDDLDK